MRSSLPLSWPAFLISPSRRLEAVVSRTRCGILHAAPQSRDRTKHQRSLRPRLCSAPLRKGYALRCVRGTTVMRSRLHGALHTRIDGVERCRTADVKSVSLLTAEAQIGDGFRDVDFSEQIAVSRVAAHAVLVGIAPTHGAPDAAFGVTAHPVSNAGLGHVRKDFAVRRLSGGHIQIKRANMRRVVGSVRESGVAHIELLLVRRDGKAIRFYEVIDDDFDLTG